jgi:ABC-2 type transport system ATP-binding protein
MLLRIDSLSKTYPNGTRALNGITLTIPEGMFGLLGPNGAGKSTLMRILATLQEADSGTARLDTGGAGDGAGAAPAIDVLAEKERVRRTLGYLPQEFGLYPRVPADELLDHFAILKGIVDARRRREIVQALLQQTNLYEVRKQKLGSYSGGMRQRFGIAVALLGQPKLIIVDEPTAGLDPAERVRFLNLLSELGERAIVILSTHIVEDVSELCSRMAIIDRGEIRLEGEPTAAIAALQGRVWRRPIAREELARYQERYSVISTKLLGGRTVVRVLADGSPGDGFAPVEASLEDVYFAAMHRVELPEAAVGVEREVAEPAR